MRYSQLFGKTVKAVSQQFESKNHELLVKAGFVEQVASGIFEYLPLGTKTLAKVENIVREEMNKIGAQEVFMPSLHPRKLWEQTDRFNSEELFKVKSSHKQEYVLAGTHEETVTPLAGKFIKSYKDLPLALYHITNKFRDEPRPKSGILRGREFRMKDLYSFHADEHDLERYYKAVLQTYLIIFERCGFNDVKVTEASGGTFTKKFSHEFNVLTPAGEVDLVYCPSCNFAQNLEIAKLKQDDICPKCQKDHLKKGKAIEIGNIFDLGKRFSESFDVTFTDKVGKKQYPIMGCYGIGTTRIMGASVEVYHDKSGIIWPSSIAPYDAHFMNLNKEDDFAEKIYNSLINNNIDVLFDDRENVSAGEKLADADLIGIPHRLVVSKKTGNKIEHKKRTESKTQLVESDKINSLLG